MVKHITCTITYPDGSTTVSRSHMISQNRIATFFGTFIKDKEGVFRWVVDSRYTLTY